ncbi:MAG: hypothetical protein NZ898_06260 [Myxococcota bacterium]|nr:hypothetical protein [Myxococcota bacterium]MDW8363357.1 hypothetical protein [Myxococcales bacterium]
MSERPPQRERESHAADEPTTVWEEAALEAAGIDPSQAGGARHEVAATTRDVGGDDPSKVVVAAGPASARAAGPGSRSAEGRPGGLGWGTTVVLALSVGALVYALVRWLKG